MLPILLSYDHRIIDGAEGARFCVHSQSWERFAFKLRLRNYKIVQLMNKKIFSLICAISCSLIWGSAFIAQDMGMDYNGPFTFTFEDCCGFLNWYLFC